MQETAIKDQGGNAKIRLFFQFGPHGNAESMRPLSGPLRAFKPHVLCMEGTDLIAEEAKRLEELLMHPVIHAALPKGTIYEEIRLAKAHGVKRLFILERSSDKAEVARHEKASEISYTLWNEGRLHFLAGNPEAALTTYRNAIYLRTENTQKREAAVKKVISNLYSELITRFPELGRESELRVLVRFGSAHTPLYKHALQSGFKEVKREVATRESHPYENALLRRITFGRTQSLEDEEIARALIAGILAGEYALMKVDPEMATLLGNMLAKKITLDKFNRMSQTIREEILNQPDNRPKKLFELMNSAFARENISLPKTPREMKEWLRKRNIPRIPKRGLLGKIKSILRRS